MAIATLTDKQRKVLRRLRKLVQRLQPEPMTIADYKKTGKKRPLKSTYNERIQTDQYKR